MIITGTHHIYNSVWFDCRKKKYRYRPRFHTTLLDVQKHTKIETVWKLFLKSLINLHVIIIITRNKDITVYSTSIHLTPVRYQ